MGKVSLTFDEEIAKSLGIGTAIILQNIEFWQMKNEANGHNFHDGYFWVYNSTTAFEKLFTFLTRRQIRTSLEKLEKNEILLVGNYNKDKRDRTKWYTSARNITIGQNSTIALVNSDRSHLSNTSNASTEKVKPLPVISNAVIKTDIKQSNKGGVEIKDSKQSNSKEVELFLKNEEEKEKKVSPKKEKISNEVIFPIVKKLSSYFPEDITKRLNRNDKLKWSDTVEKLIRLDEYTKEQIERAVEIGRKDNFWKNNFLSITKLRKKDKQDVKYIQVFLNLDPEKKDDTGDGNYEHKPTEKPKWI